MTLDFPKADAAPVEPTVTRESYYRFNGLLALATALPLLGVAAFNVIVNPYGLYPAPVRPGFNQAQPNKSNNMRMFKAADITRLRPNAVFLGSSRTEYGLDPAHPVFAADNTYNLALGAATPYELRRYLEHALVNQPNLTRVVINVDEFMFNTLNVENPSFAEQRLARRGLWLMDIVNTTLSLDTFNASRRNLRVSKANPDYESYQPDGQLNLRPIDRQPDKTDYRFRNSIGFYFKAFPGAYQLSDDYLAEFKALIELCQSRGLDYQVYISPSHVTRWEAIRAAGHWPQYEQMKRELAQITPIWDFSGYNSITTERLQPEMDYYIDDSHYTETVGNLVLDRMYDDSAKGVPEDFGVVLTPATVDDHLETINRDRNRWASENPDIVELVENIYQEHLPN
ncbi:MAG: hypothetical protein AAFZ80_07505 [Cyanobacteria bacterium P01_A01_bin.105]